MHTISIDGTLWLRCHCLSTVQGVIKAHRLGRDAHLTMTVSLYDGHTTYTVEPTERRLTS